MIYLIGVDHEMQSDFISSPFWNEIRKILKIELINHIKNKKINVLAEEHSVQALHGKRSVLQDLAQENNLIHLFCDPDRDMRKQSGILLPGEYKTPEDKYNADQMREKYWLKLLNPYLGKEILFLSGAFHVTAFNLLLIQNANNTEIIHYYFLNDVIAPRTKTIQIS